MDEPQFLSSVEVFDGTSWRAGPDLITGRAALGLAPYNGLLYAVGGFDGDNYLSSVEVYEPSSDTWNGAVSMTRVCVGMRSRIVTARRETREETTRRRIARGVDVARAWTSRADARYAVVWRAFVIRHSSSLDARRRGRASARVEDARDDARESARVRDDDDDACATPTERSRSSSRANETVRLLESMTVVSRAGVADADVDRADVWELPRTCDSCGNYILPGRARWACARCLEEGVEYDACETCLARLAREESARVKRGKGKKGAKKRKVDAHAHGRAAFVLAEAPDEEDEDEKR